MLFPISKKKKKEEEKEEEDKDFTKSFYREYLATQYRAKWFTKRSILRKNK